MEELRPAQTSSGLAVALGAGLVLALAEQRLAILAWVGLLVGGIGAGAYAARHDERPVGGVGALVGLGAITGFLTTTAALSEIVLLLPGLVGLGVLGAGLAPVRGGRARLLVKAGAAGLFGTVVLAGLFRSGEPSVVLLAGVGAVVAWDAGEHAIGVGEQLGPAASTWRCELPHVVATALVGVGGTVAILASREVGAASLSLPAFVMVFVALLLFTVALRS